MDGSFTGDSGGKQAELCQKPKPADFRELKKIILMSGETLRAYAEAGVRDVLIEAPPATEERFRALQASGLGIAERVRAEGLYSRHAARDGRAEEDILSRASLIYHTGRLGMALHAVDRDIESSDARRNYALSHLSSEDRHELSVLSSMPTSWNITPAQAARDARRLEIEQKVRNHQDETAFHLMQSRHLRVIGKSCEI